MKNFIYTFFLALLCVIACKSRLQQNTIQDTKAAEIYEPPSFGTKVTKEEYVELCKKYDVPIPDKPLYDRSFWQKKTLSNPTLPHYGELSNKATLYQHQNEDSSGCVYIVGEQLSLDPKEKQKKSGTICWAKNGHACFWELSDIPAEKNPEKDDYFIVTNHDEVHAFGDKLKVSCTRCHIGDNVTIGHGNSGPADSNFNNLSETPFKTAIAPVIWPKNEKGSDKIQCAEGCHSIPKPALLYCTNTALMLNNGLMTAEALGIVGDAKPTEEECAPFIELTKECMEIWNKQPSNQFEEAVKYGGCKAFLPKETEDSKSDEHKHQNQGSPYFTCNAPPVHYCNPTHGCFDILHPSCSQQP